MSSYEFLNFCPTPGEKYIGIATIRVEKRFIFRFKILMKDDGQSYPMAASVKMASKEGKDTYASAFQFDSSYEFDEVKSFVMENVEKYLRRAEEIARQPTQSTHRGPFPTPTQDARSVFSSPGAINSPSGYGYTNQHAIAQPIQEEQQNLPF